MINNFIKYTITYLLKRKLKLRKILRNYLNFIKIKKISIQRLRFNNKDEYVKH